MPKMLSTGTLRSPNIVPFGLKGNDIVDLSIPGAWETLLRKLTDQYTYKFAEVAPTLPKFGTVKIEPFKPTDPV
ncbi:hypothetical protein [Chitinophaga agri]|uniref:Uncharacterized protein n=1 Tax=Chitinophaga agri TaxID=2703787 RepID=A0A6B9ZMM6_9BACT|nr:hypothetical protein [Chitinophaga agri]QHS63256.1 hypothetical protein GWR21_27825 [Chitinophaga agri]